MPRYQLVDVYTKPEMVLIEPKAKVKFIHNKDGSVSSTSLLGNLILSSGIPFLEK